MAAGLAMLNAVSEPGFYDKLTEKTSKLVDGIKAAADEEGIPLAVNQVGAMFGFFFTKEDNISKYAQVVECDMPRFRAFYHAMLEEGVYLAPSAFEAGFVSNAHDDAEIETTIAAAKRVFNKLANQ